MSMVPKTHPKLYSSSLIPIFQARNEEGLSPFPLYELPHPVTPINLTFYLCLKYTHYLPLHSNTLLRLPSSFI